MSARQRLKAALTLAAARVGRSREGADAHV